MSDVILGEIHNYVPGFYPDEDTEHLYGLCPCGKELKIPMPDYPGLYNIKCPKCSYVIGVVTLGRLHKDGRGMDVLPSIDFDYDGD